MALRIILTAIPIQMIMHAGKECEAILIGFPHILKLGEIVTEGKDGKRWVVEFSSLYYSNILLQCKV